MRSRPALRAELCAPRDGHARHVQPKPSSETARSGRKMLAVSPNPQSRNRLWFISDRSTAKIPPPDWLNSFRMAPTKFTRLTRVNNPRGIVRISRVKCGNSPENMFSRSQSRVFLPGVYSDWIGFGLLTTIGLMRVGEDSGTCEIVKNTSTCLAIWLFVWQSGRRTESTGGKVD